MKILIALSALVFVVAAASPSEVAPVIATDGFFIEDGADATDTEVGAAVFDARSGGGLFYAVVLVDEPPAGATTYADAVLDELPRQEGTVLVVGPQTVGWASNNDVWPSAELDRALDASLNASTSGAVVTAFVSELIEPSSSGGGGGGAWLLVIGVVIVGGIGFVIWRGSRSRRVSDTQRLADLKAKAQLQIDAIANDILDDADEISEAANADATDHFEAATAVYGEAAGRLEAATTARQVVDISAELDLAIWHLDAAEAILDGQPVPPKPEPPVFPDPVTAPPPPPPRSPASAPGSPAPLPTYQRRSERRSGFGADDMVKAMIAMQAMRSIGRSFGGGSSSAGRTSKPPRSTGRSRGGGRRR
ncbi:MAG TPA: DUF6676 family protein [Acidimicrobiia bacterium]|nr:DUF6676 family protein [Acidimicrobiia bacterium]